MNKQQVKQQIIKNMKGNADYNECDLNYDVWELYDVQWTESMDYMSKDELVMYCEIKTMKLVDELCEELLQ